MKIYAIIIHIDKVYELARVRRPKYNCVSSNKSESDVKLGFKRHP